MTPGSCGLAATLPSSSMVMLSDRQGASAADSSGEIPGKLPPLIPTISPISSGAENSGYPFSVMKVPPVIAICAVTPPCAAGTI